jgi:hypothetical protein
MSRSGRGAGLGAALFEKCVYDERGQLTNANMADYLVPMSAEMPDIDVGHVVSPMLESELGAKGAGEAGTAGAAAAVTNAVNDALRPFGTIITEIPLTPDYSLGHRADLIQMRCDDKRSVQVEREAMDKAQRALQTGSMKSGYDVADHHLPPSQGSLLPFVCLIPPGRASDRWSVAVTTTFDGIF